MSPESAPNEPHRRPVSAARNAALPQKAFSGSRPRATVELTRTAVSRHPFLNHGTCLAAGDATLREGIRIPNASRWFAGGNPVPLEHGFRFYTCVALAGSRHFAHRGMILRFSAPFPPGRLGLIDPGPGGGFEQISFGPEALSELRRRLTHYSIDGGATWEAVGVQSADPAPTSS